MSTKTKVVHHIQLSNYGKYSTAITLTVDTKTKKGIHLRQIKVAETFCVSFLVSAVHVTR